MDFWIDAAALLLGIGGLLGCILPVLPGPPLSYAGLALVFFWGDDPGAVRPLWMWILLALTLAVTVLDYVVPAYFTRKTGGSASASRASFVGMLLGIPFFPPVGMIAGAFAGAFLAELLLERKNREDAFRAAWGSFLGFLLGTGLKSAVSLWIIWFIVKGW